VFVLRQVRPGAPSEPMIEERQKLVSVLEAQVAALGLRIERKHGGPLTADEINDDLDSELVCVEGAIDEYVRSSEWPVALSIEQLVTLQIRAFSASRMPQGNPQAEKGKLIRWLLIDFWTIGGYLFRDAFVSEMVRPKSEKDVLLRWGRFLDAQSYVNQSRIEASHGRPFVADEIDVIFLNTDADLNRAAIEQAIEAFIRDEKWPELTFAQLVNMMHRLQTSSSIILNLLTDKLKPRALSVPMPDPGDFAAFVRWLFIDTWNFKGPAYIDALTDAFLAEKSK
jgi:hypothetical protein